MIDPTHNQLDQHSVDIELQLLIQAIHIKYSYDFRNYAGASVKRRVLHAIKQMNCNSISELQARVLHDVDTFTALLQYLTVPTTEMFRDPLYFLALREQVVPFLKTYPSLKIWIAGCSTGEEIYSMAIMLQEEDLLERSIIYATDINPQSLEKARKGIFSLDKVRDYTVNYQSSGGKRSLSDYYMAAYDGALFDRSLIENVSFADHSLATDSVFAETHLVCCRNVMIYFNQELQERSLGLFHDSLCHRGFLGLGSKESIDFSDYANHFEPLVKSQRLYRKL
jgi:chemotaxis protein methyltransferase CheR